MDEAPFAARVGTTVQAQWHLDALLGVGGMAAVYAATGPHGEKVALKILHREYRDDPKILVRFRREADVALLVDHPALVRVHDASFVHASEPEPPPDESEDTSPTTTRSGALHSELVRTAEGEPFLVMDLLEGESIRDIWRRAGRTLPLQEALHIAERVVDCLIACHDAGVIHRDLKPANVFRTREGLIKLLDFGVAQVAGSSVDLDAAGTALGTPAYIAPEQAMGLAAQLDGRSDLFSVAALLHALITGHRLHVARTTQESLILAATRPVPSITTIAPNLPPAVVRLIDKGLSWDRRQRFADAREMHDAILTAATLAQAWNDDALDQALAPPPESLAPRPLVTRSEYAPPRLASLVPGEDTSSVKRAYASLGEVLTAAREFDWGHPACDRALASAHDALVHVLERNPEWGKLSVKPYAFSARGTTVWEPAMPFDFVPHHLYEAGVRVLELEPTISMRELERLLRVLARDRDDIASDDDLATILWEQGLTFRTAPPMQSTSAASIAQFWQTAQALERTLADQLAATSSIPSQESVLPSLEREALERGLAAEGREVRARHVTALARALTHAATIERSAPLLRTLQRASEAELLQGHFDELCTFFENFCSELRGLLPNATFREALLVTLADALFGSDAFVLLGRYLTAVPGDIVLAKPILELLGPAELPRALGAARDASSDLRDLFLGYVSRVGRGREEQIADAAEGLDAERAFAFLEALRDVGTERAHSLVEELSKHSDPAVRVSASVVVQDGSARDDELALLLSDPSPATRIQVLRLAQHIQADALFERVSRLVSEAAPASAEELLERMRTLLVLGGEGGEAQAIEVARKGGFFVSQSRESAREAACHALAEHSSSRSTASILDDVAKARLGVSETVRKAAMKAARIIRERADESDEPLEGEAS
ncbi:MAG: serine/threonine-protein kinase [Polyangiaceae bacterium]